MPVLIGLTGGIAAGKSTIAGQLAQLGALIVDADQLVRAVQSRGEPGLRAIVAEFGSRVLQPNGELDRQALGALVFGHPEKLARLNLIIHPLVNWRFQQIVEANPESIIVHDIPLLVELGITHRYHLTIVAMADEQVRVRRMVQTRGLDEEQAQLRIRAQAGDDERRAAGDVLLDTDVPMEELLETVRRLWRERIEPFAAGVMHGKLGDIATQQRDIGGLDAGQVARLRARLEYFTDGLIDLEVGRGGGMLLSSVGVDAAAALLQRAGYVPVDGDSQKQHFYYADPGLALSVGFRVSRPAGSA